jgi:N-acetylglucosamine-6-phosphate deacetylase
MGEITVVRNGTLITPFRIIKNGTVVFEDEKISAVGPKDEIETLTGARIIDASQKIVTPGFIDLHVHGGRGRSVMDASAETVKELAKSKEPRNNGFPPHHDLGISGKACRCSQSSEGGYMEKV